MLSYYNIILLYYPYKKISNLNILTKKNFAILSRASTDSEVNRIKDCTIARQHQRDMNTKTLRIRIVLLVVQTMFRFSSN